MNWETEAAYIQKTLSSLNSLEESHARESAALKKAEREEQDCQGAQEVLQSIALTVQQQAHKKISHVVSSCLSAVFDDPYEFRIEFERKRGRTEASLKFRRRELEVDPLSAAGGGVVDVAAFALRIACLVLHRPRLSPVVILDEPMKFVSVQYQDRVRQMLEQISEDLKVQIIMVTHADNLATGNVINL